MKKKKGSTRPEDIYNPKIAQSTVLLSYLSTAATPTSTSRTCREDPSVLHLDKLLFALKFVNIEGFGEKKKKLLPVAFEASEERVRNTRE